MGYTHEFTLPADELPICHGFEEFANSLTIRFEMESAYGEDELAEWECTTIFGERPTGEVVRFIDDNFGRVKFDDAIQEACWNEWAKIQDGWADDAAEYRAEQAMEPSSRDIAMMDMGMDVPAR